MKHVKVLATLLSSFVMHTSKTYSFVIRNWHMECCFMTNDDDRVVNTLCVSLISFKFFGKARQKLVML